jgi:hypothetical protein
MVKDEIEKKLITKKDLIKPELTKLTRKTRNSVIKL